MVAEGPLGSAENPGMEFKVCGTGRNFRLPSAIV
jgi:hypothetical protein